MEERISVLDESREEFLDGHETGAENKKQYVDNQIEEIRQAVEVKERELVCAQEDDVNELDEERERLREDVTESTQGRERENKVQEKKIEWWESVMENDKLKKQVESVNLKV